MIVVNVGHARAHCSATVASSSNSQHDAPLAMRRKPAKASSNGAEASNASCIQTTFSTNGGCRRRMRTYEVVLLNKGDDVQRLEVWQARSELGEEFAWCRRINDEDR